MAKETWLTPYLEVWKSLCGGDLAVGPAVKALAPVRKDLGDAEALIRFEWYLRSTPPQYASAARFAATHGQYAQNYVPPSTATSDRVRPATRGRVIA